MSAYQPLTLKKVKSTSPTAKFRKGVMSYGGTSLAANDSLIVPVLVKTPQGEKFHVVYTKVDDNPVWKAAGRVYIQGVGRFEIQPYGADSRAVDRNSEEVRSTLIDAIERVVYQFLHSVDYAAREAAKTDDQRAEEARVKAETAYVLGVVRGFLERDKADRTNRFEAWMDEAGVDSDQRDAFLSTFVSMAR